MSDNQPSAQAVKFGLDELDGTITERLAEVARQVPERPALSDGSGTPLSFEELVTLTTGGSAWLAELQPDDRSPVVLLADHAPMTIASELAIIGCGRPAMPLDPGYPAGQLAALIDEAGPGLIVCNPHHRELADEIAGEIEVVEWDEVPAGDGPTPNPVSTDPAFLLFTSGSTGRPKGATPNHRAFINGAQALCAEGVFGLGDRVAMIAPLSFAAAGAQTMWALLSGAEVCPFPAKERGLPAFLGWMREAGITSFPTQASLGRAVAGFLGDQPLPQLRMVMPGGEMIHGTDVGLYRGMGQGPVRVVPVYVSTEMMLMAWEDIGADAPDVEGTVRLGREVPGIGLEVEPLDDDGETDVGELIVVSAISNNGYWGAPDLTAESFKFDRDVDRMRYRTGDLGRCVDGAIEIVGRTDSMVKIRGARVELGAVEAVLARVEEVGEAAVVAVPLGSDWVLVAHVTSTEDQEAQPALVRGRLRQNLPPQMVPLRVVNHEGLPRLPNGKIDRVTLTEWPLEVVAEVVEPRTPTEQRLSDLVCELTGTAGVGVTQDLFEAGIDSLVAIEVIVRLEQDLGVRLAMSSWIELTTVEEIASEIDRLGTTSGERWASLTVIQRGEDDRAPLVLTNDLHGTAFRVSSLGPALGEDLPCIGTDSPLLEGKPGAPNTLEGVASVHVDELLERHTEGPLHLLGYSFGAPLAYEIAQQWRRRGGELGFLGLLDFGPVHVRHKLRRSEGPRPPGGYPDQPSSDLPPYRKVAFWADSVRDAEPGQRLVALSRALDVGKPVDRALAELDLRRHGLIRPELRGAYAWYQQMDMAIAYRPQPLDHPAFLFLSDTTAKGRIDVSRRLDHRSAQDPTLGWDAYLDRLTVVPIVGYHNDLLKDPYVEDVGRRVRATFDEATASKRNVGA